MTRHTAVGVINLGLRTASSPGSRSTGGVMLRPGRTIPRIPPSQLGPYSLYHPPIAQQWRFDVVVIFHRQLSPRTFQKGQWRDGNPLHAISVLQSLAKTRGQYSTTRRASDCASVRYSDSTLQYNHYQPMLLVVVVFLLIFYFTFRRSPEKVAEGGLYRTRAKPTVPPSRISPQAAPPLIIRYLVLDK